jgi:hypothetical protein
MILSANKELKMSVIRIEAELPFETLLKAVEQLSLPDLEKLMSQVMSSQAKRKAPFS